jgi:hypothetical protein
MCTSFPVWATVVVTILTIVVFGAAIFGGIVYAVHKDPLEPGRS